MKVTQNESEQVLDEMFGTSGEREKPPNSQAEPENDGKLSPQQRELNIQLGSGQGYYDGEDGEDDEDTLESPDPNDIDEPDNYDIKKLTNQSPTKMRF